MTDERITELENEYGGDCESMDNAEFTITLTADEYTLMVKAAEKGKGPISDHLFGKLIAIGIERMRQVEREKVLDSDLVFAPERTGRVF